MTVTVAILLALNPPFFTSLMTGNNFSLQLSNHMHNVLLISINTGYEQGEKRLFSTNPKNPTTD